MVEEAEKKEGIAGVLEVEAPVAGGAQPPDFASRLVLLGAERGVAESVGAQEIELLRDGLLYARRRRVELREEAASCVEFAHACRVAWRH